MSDTGDTGDTGAVLEVNAAYYAAFEAGDLDAMTGLWLDVDSALCVHPGGLAVRGGSAVRRSWAVVMATTPYIQFVLTDVVVHVLGDTAHVTCHENVLTAGGPGAAAHDLAGTTALALNVFRRTPGGWRLWLHQAAPVLVEEA